MDKLLTLVTVMVTGILGMQAVGLDGASPRKTLGEGTGGTSSADPLPPPSLILQSTPFLPLVVLVAWLLVWLAGRSWRTSSMA